MDLTKEFENESEFINETKEHFGTFTKIDSDEWKIQKFIPLKGLDVQVYGPFTVTDNRHIAIISWKKEGDAKVEERLKNYASNLTGVQWSIRRWPKAEGTVKIGHLVLKNTHHRCMSIWYD